MFVRLVWCRFLSGSRRGHALSIFDSACAVFAYRQLSGGPRELCGVSLAPVVSLVMTGALDAKAWDPKDSSRHGA